MVAASRRLRVLAISHAYPRHRASSHGIFIHRWHVGLQSCGLDVHVLQLAQWTPPWPLSEIDETWRRHRRERLGMINERDGITVHHPRSFTPRPSRFFPGDPWDRDVRALVRYCRSDPKLVDADVVLGHFMVPDGYHALGLARELGLPAAGVAWGDDVHAWPKQWPYWRNGLISVLREIDAPIACSHRLAADANAWLEMPRNDWHVVYGGVDHRTFFPAADRRSARQAIPVDRVRNDEEARVVLMLGQAVPAKGYVELLDAWAIVAPSAPGWHLVMGGASSPELDIPTEIARRRLAHCAHWIGQQPAERIPAILQGCDGFVLPSHNEGLSLSVLEAMATGVPTITTNVGGHAEVIASEDEGWLIPARDVPALVRALSELVSSDRERVRRGAGGRRAARRVGSPADNAAHLATVLEELVQRGRPADSRAASRALARP